MSIFFPQLLALEGTEVAAADLNGDARPDLVVGSEPDLTFYLNDGSGNLTLVGRAPGGEQPTGLAVVDLDEDGHVDIVVANHDTDHLTLLLGDGSGNFRPAPNSPLRIDVLPHPHAVRALDLDGDGHVDLVIDNREGEGLLILPGLGDGTFAHPGIQVGVGGDPYRGIAVGDVDGDGRRGKFVIRRKNNHLGQQQDGFSIVQFPMVMR